MGEKHVTESRKKTKSSSGPTVVGARDHVPRVHPDPDGNRAQRRAAAKQQKKGGN